MAATPAAATAGDLAAYMKARAADGDGRVMQAARGYDAALAAAPDNVLVAGRAYREGLRAGDDALVDRALAVLATADALPNDAALVLVARAAGAGDVAAARRAVAGIGAGPLALLKPALSAWVAFASGGDALAPLKPAPKDAVARRFADEARALLLIATGRVDEGSAALRTLLAADSGNLDLRIAAAQLLAAGGHADVARALTAGEQPALAAFRARLDSGSGAGVAPTLAFGVSRIFTRVTAELANQPGSLSITLTRAALRAEPANDRAKLLLANALASANAPDRALALVESIPADSLYAATARTGRVQILAGAGEDKAALVAARALAKGDDARVADIQRLGDLLSAAGRHDEAASAYDRVLERGGRDDWAAWLQYGGALDQAKRWPEARAALEKAVEYGPDEPLALNYLGYAQLERGENVAAAQALLVKANRLKPDDGAIADSLGWAYHLTGETRRAIPLLERAAMDAPENATISEHLGDAYWAIGRRYEARYAWAAAAVVAEGGEAARLSAKARTGIVARP